MRLSLASARGLLGGWLIALTIPLLVDPHTITAWSAAGLGGGWRIALAAAELLGAALFAFETPIFAGFALLILSFLAAAIVHLHHAEIPWWLLAYAAATTLLWRLSARARETGRRDPGAPVPG